jgi:hypothetical protein
LTKVPASGRNINNHNKNGLFSRHSVLQRTGDGKMTISVRRWSELIHEARARLEFVQKELNYEVNRDDALERLRLTYAHILGGGGEAAAASDPDDAEDADDQDAGDDSAE